MERDRDEIRKQVRQRLSERKQAAAGGTLSWRVQASDLSSLSSVKTLLHALNDAYVSSTTIERLVNEIPVLRARCIRRAAFGLDLEVLPGLSESLARIGNMGLEAELLTVLEDLTILSSELSDD